MKQFQGIYTRNVVPKKSYIKTLMKYEAVIYVLQWVFIVAVIIGLDILFVNSIK